MSVCFRFDSGVRQVYRFPLAFYCIYGCSDVDETGDGEEAE